MLAYAFDLIQSIRGVARRDREAGTGHPRQGTVIVGKLPSHFETLARLPKYEFSTGGVISIVIFTRDRSEMGPYSVLIPKFFSKNSPIYGRLSL